MSASSYFSLAGTLDAGGIAFRARRGLELVVDFLTDGRMFWPRGGYVEEDELATSGDDDFVPMGVMGSGDSPPGDSEDSPRYVKMFCAIDMSSSSSVSS